ncbi:MAG TPA: hypothetical protein VES42_11795 [Pilimelia sp.]|nr:hypothetical protein [Pilimelia sp.]
MVTDDIERVLAVAADDSTAPPSGVEATPVYRAGRLRRRLWYAGTGAAATTTALALTGGYLALAGTPADEPVDVGARPPGAKSSCGQLAEAVTETLRSALPADLEWSQPTVPEGAEAADCERGGLFWVKFVVAGQEHQLGFEGGAEPQGRGCDPTRDVVRCEQIPGGEVGHLASRDEYGVLLRNKDAYFFLGLSDPGTEQPVTTAQLSQAAQRVAAERFGS